MSNQLPRSILIISLVLLAAVASPAVGQQRRMPANNLAQQSSNESAAAVFAIIEPRSGLKAEAYPLGVLVARRESNGRLRKSL